jgi:hypothetical protein
MRIIQQDMEWGKSAETMEELSSNFQEMET